LSGFCYLLVSSVDWCTAYIGETMTLHRRLIQHNSGYGSCQTAAANKRPWALICYVVGFDGIRTAMRGFERHWQEEARIMMNRERAPRTIASIVESAERLIRNNNTVGANPNCPYFGLTLRLVKHALIDSSSF